MKKIRRIEYNIMAWFLLRAAIVGVLISSIINYSRQDAYISVLITMIIGFIPLVLFQKLKGLNPDYNIIELNNQLGFFGKLCNILMMITVFGFTAIIFWNLVNFVSTEFLFKTPSLVVALFFILPILYAGVKNFNTVGKISLISFSFIIFTIILVEIGIFKEVSLSNLMPILNNGFNGVLKSSFLILAYNVLPIFVLLVIPKNMIRQDSEKMTLFFYLISMLSLVNLLIFIIGGFSIELTSIYDYAEFHIFKRFTLGNFIDKMESFLSIEWLLGMILSIIICIHYLKKSFKQMTKINQKASNFFVLLLCITLVIISTFLFTTPNKMTYFVVNIYVYVMVFGLFVIPLISYITNKKKVTLN